jgi:hypothetical protein
VGLVIAELHVGRGDEHVDVVGRMHRRDGHTMVVKIGGLRLLDLEIAVPDFN